MTALVTAFIVGLLMCMAVIARGGLYEEPKGIFTWMSYIGPTLVFGSSIIFMFTEPTQEPEPLSQSEIVLAIEDVLRRQGSPSVCEPISPSEINCQLIVDPKANP